MSGNQLEHTPLPWILTWTDFERGGSRFNIDFSHDSANGDKATGNIFLGDGQRGSHGRANAEFIIRACNAHEEMLEALKDMTELVDCLYEVSPPHLIRARFAKARAAIAKAEGRP